MESRKSCKWTDLPEHLLSIISNFLPIRSYICARAVCSWWRSAIQARPSLPHPPPWLLLPSDSGIESELCTFVSIPTGHAIQYPLPQLHGMRCVGSYDEWLAVADLSLNGSLLNPFTGMQIHLPPMTTLPGVEAVYTDNNNSPSGFLLHDSILEPTYYSLESFRDLRIQKIIFAPNPNPYNYIAFVICNFLGLPVAYTKTGDTKWKVLEDSDAERKHPVFVNDIVHRDGKFYGVGSCAEVLMFDLSGTSPRITIFSKGLYHRIVRSTDEYLPNTLEFNKLLVLSNDSIIYQVWWKNNEIYLHNDDHDDVDVDDIVENDDNFRYVTEAIIVLRHDPEHQPCWREVRELNGHCILIGNKNTICVPATTNMPGLRANCIYYTDYYFRDVWMFDIEKQKTELCYPLDSQFNWPPPIWFLPSME